MYLNCGCVWVKIWGGKKKRNRRQNRKKGHFCNAQAESQRRLRVRGCGTSVRGAEPHPLLTCQRRATPAPQFRTPVPFEVPRALRSRVGLAGDSHFFALAVLGLAGTSAGRSPAARCWRSRHIFPLSVTVFRADAVGPTRAPYYFSVQLPFLACAVLVKLSRACRANSACSVAVGFQNEQGQGLPRR